MRTALKDFDIVVHLAAIGGASACDRGPGMATSVNLGAVKLLNRLRSPQQLVIYPNANSGYGRRTRRLDRGGNVPGWWRKHKLLGFQCDSASLDIGTPETYRAAEELFARLAGCESLRFVIDGGGDSSGRGFGRVLDFALSPIIPLTTT